MKSIILAAGRGTRMGDLTLDTPKPMLPVRGKPKLAWSIENLPEQIDEVVLVVGYLKEQVVDYFGDEYDGKKITYIEQVDLNGTAGAINLAKSHISEGEKFLVVMGDDLYAKSDLEKLMEYDYAALAFEEKEHAYKFGVMMTNEAGKVIDIVENPEGMKEGLVNLNAFVLKGDYFKTELVPKSPGDIEFGLPQTIMEMLHNDESKEMKVIGTQKWFAIGDPEAYAKASEKLKEFVG